VWSIAARRARPADPRHLVTRRGRHGQAERLDDLGADEFARVWRVQQMSRRSILCFIVLSGTLRLRPVAGTFQSARSSDLRMKLRS